MTTVWFRVADLDAARTFYRGTLGFDEAYVDEGDRWARLVRGSAEVALAEGGARGGRGSRPHASTSPT